MDTVIAQIKSLAGSANEATRKNMTDQLRELSYSLESPDDTLQRVMYLVSMSPNMRILALLPNSSESQGRSRSGGHRPQAFRVAGCKYGTNDIGAATEKDKDRSSPARWDQPLKGHCCSQQQLEKDVSWGTSALWHWSKRFKEIPLGPQMWRTLWLSQEIRQECIICKSSTQARIACCCSSSRPESHLYRVPVIADLDELSVSILVGRCTKSFPTS